MSDSLSYHTTCGKSRSRRINRATHSLHIIADTAAIHDVNKINGATCTHFVQVLLLFSIESKQRFQIMLSSRYFV